jgi:tetratricopeptide (TPR) repeat protein
MASKKTCLQWKLEGAQHRKKQQWRKAIHWYTRALDMKSDEAILYSNRGFCENQLENFESAREDAEHAIHLDPKNPKFYHVLSEALLGLRSPEKALEA